MTAHEANKINLDKEENTEKLKELVEYLQNFLHLAEIKVFKLEISFSNSKTIKDNLNPK